jgi:hypothetical protein
VRWSCRGLWEHHFDLSEQVQLAKDAKQGPRLGGFSRFQPLQSAFSHASPFGQFGLGQILVDAELDQSPAQFLQKGLIMFQFLKLHGFD